VLANPRFIKEQGLREFVTATLEGSLREATRRIRATALPASDVRGRVRVLKAILVETARDRGVALTTGR